MNHPETINYKGITWYKLDSPTTPNGHTRYSNGKSIFGGERKTILLNQDEHIIEE